MMPNSDRTGTDNVVFKRNSGELKTVSGLSYATKKTSTNNNENETFYDSSTSVAILHYITLFILGFLTWVLLWYVLGDRWRWDGEWFVLLMVAVVAWAGGLLLEGVTTLPPLLFALLTGILARNLGLLDMRDYTHVDVFLRKIYPVVILGKGSLGWNLGFMRSNWRRVLALGVLPWTLEVITVAVCTKYFLELPWLWGFLLGSIYASLSCPVIMGSVQRVGAGAQAWPDLVCTAGGLDTALSVGVYGIFYSLIFHEASDVIRYVKAGVTLLCGAAAGAAAGYAARAVPHARDPYVAPLRVLFVLTAGLAASFTSMQLGWGGIAGVAVLCCNATAAYFWQRSGWELNKNPASTAYRVLWSACEPALFAYTGTFFVIDWSISQTMLLGLAILMICLTVRLATAAVACWDFTIREKIFVCCTWIPKSIVEAVLCPLAIDTLLLRGDASAAEMQHAETLMRIIVQAIIITTPIGFLLTSQLGPNLLKESKSDCENSLTPKESDVNRD